MATVIGLFNTMDDAQRAVHALIDSGFRREGISLVARDERGQPVRQNAVGDTESAAEGAGAGAVGGTVVGGAIGLLIGAGLLTIPGIGPVLAAGPLAAAIGTATAAAGAGALGAGLGAATGGLVGGLIGAGVPEDEANYYNQSVQRGNVLVSATIDNSSAASARDLMHRHGAVDIDNRSLGPQTGAMSSSTGTGIYEAPATTNPGYTRGERDMSSAADGPDFARGERTIPRDTGEAGGSYPPGDFARGQRSYNDYEGDFRSHYQSTYNPNARTYEDYDPAYRYGYSLTSNKRIQGDRWEDIEADARRDWEHDNPTSAWDEFKATVRYAWEKARGLR